MTMNVRLPTMWHSWFGAVLVFCAFISHETKAWTSICQGNRYQHSSPLRLALPNDVSFEYSRKNVYRLKLDDRAVSELQRRLQLQQQEGVQGLFPSSELVQVEGYVTAKREYGKSFCFVDLSNRGNTVPVQAMFKRQAFVDSQSFDGFMNSILPGIRLCITGPVVPTRNPGEAVVLIQHLCIEKLPHNPQHVRKLLKLVSDGLLDAKDLAPAAEMCEKQLLQAIDEAKHEMEIGHPKLFNSLANRILENLKEKNEVDDEYPNLGNNRKYAHSLPKPPRELRPSKLLLRMGMQQIETGTPNSFLSIQAALSHFLEKTSKTNAEIIDIMGCVQNRSRFKGSITSLEIVDQIIHAGRFGHSAYSEPVLSVQEWDEVGDSFIGSRLKCIVHPKMLQDQPTCDSKLIGHVLAPGSHIKLQGYIVSSNSPTSDVLTEERPVLWVQKISLLRSSWRPSIVSFIVEQVVEGKFNREEAAKALDISEQEMERIVGLDDVTKRQWESAEISHKMQQRSIDHSLQVDPEALAVLKTFDRLRAKYPIKAVAAAPICSAGTDFVSTPGSRWKRKKEPQLEWMVQQIESVLQQSYHDGQQDMKSPLRVLDIGGGKGFLANHLARRLLDMGYHVKILVVDVSEGAIDNGRLRSERRNLSHAVTYALADASTTDFSAYGPMDLVVALHACGGLTDVALSHACHQRAAFVICPCCFCSNPHLRIPLYSKSQAEQQSMSIPEWLGVDSHLYEKLNLLAEAQGDINLANQATHGLCSIRSSAVEAWASTPMNVSINTFPVAFSTRNFCLVGKLLDPDEKTHKATAS